MTDTVVTPEVVEPVADPAAIMAAAEPAAPAAPARPDALPETYWDEATGAVKPEAFSRLAELEAAEVARAAAVPEAYELKLAEPIVGLDGKAVEFDPADPLAAAVLPVFKKHGLSQDAVSDVLSAFAAQEIEAAKESQAFVAAEQVKLGAEHAKRTAALHATVTAAVGAEAAETLRLSMGSAAAVIALEQLVSKVTGAAISAGPPATPDSDLDGLSGEQLLTAIRARKAG